MPNDFLVTTKNRPHLNRAREPLTSPDSARIFRISPDEIMLQMRMVKSYASVALTSKEARLVAAQLVQLADEVEG